MARNIISFYNEKGDILVFKDGYIIFKAFPWNGIYESVVCVSYNSNVNFNVDSSNSLDKLYLWHYHLVHIYKKRIAKIQSDGILESFDLKSDDVRESYLLGNMTKSHSQWLVK